MCIRYKRPLADIAKIAFIRGRKYKEVWMRKTTRKRDGPPNDGYKMGPQTMGTRWAIMLRTLLHVETC